MVGKNPPLPRTYPAFRFVTALASLLLFFSVGLNVLVPEMAAQPPAFGMGGGAPEVFSAQAPEETEVPLAEAPAAEPPAELLPMPTVTLSSEESARVDETPAGQELVTGDSSTEDRSEIQTIPSEQREAPPPVPPVWLMVLGGVASLGAVVMVMMRRLAAERWREK